MDDPHRPDAEAAEPWPVFGSTPPDREEPVLDRFLGPVVIAADVFGDAQRVIDVAAVELGEGEDVVARGADHHLLVRHRARFPLHPLTNVARG